MPPSPPERPAPETSDSPSRDRDLLIGAVREASAIALTFFGQSPAVRVKADGTQVSEADLAIDAHLRHALTRARPDYGWLSEESDDDHSRLDKTRVWIVDPIDGTRAFLQERTDWTIAAALVENGAPVLGVVYNPPHDELFEAVRGGGARVNGARVHVTERAGLEGASLIVSKGFVRRRDWPEPFPPVETTWVNSIAYRLALVGAGRYDATVSLSNKSDWDIAAADLLVREAGGRITTHSGAPFVYNRPVPVHDSVVAAGPGLYGALMARISHLDLP